MSTINYNGYQGEVSYRDGKLFIRVLHIDDFISTECDCASEVSKEFAQLVDEYIETCKELGQEPNKPFKGTFNVRVSPDLHRKAAMAAAKENTSLNAWVSSAIEEKLGSEDKKMHFASVTMRILSNHQQANYWSPKDRMQSDSTHSFSEDLMRKVMTVLTQERGLPKVDLLQRRSH